MPKASPLLTIGKAAATAGVSPDTLRHYEREGLLPHPKTTDAGSAYTTTLRLNGLRL